MNTPEQQPTSLAATILEKIRSSKLQPHTRTYFITQSVIAALGIALVACILVFASSFIFFTLRQTGAWFAPGLGPRGWLVVWTALPWVFVLVVVGLVVVLELMLRRYQRVYRRPVLYTTVGLVTMTVAVGLVAARSPFHHQAYRFAKDRKPPILSDLYQGYGDRRFHRMLIGQVIGFESDGFTITLRDGSAVLVKVSSATKLPQEFKLAEGDMVVVMGERQDEVMNAFGVRIVDDEFDFPPPPMRGGRNRGMPPLVPTEINWPPFQ